MIHEVWWRDCGSLVAIPRARHFSMPQVPIGLTDTLSGFTQKVNELFIVKGGIGSRADEIGVRWERKSEARSQKSEVRNRIGQGD